MTTVVTEGRFYLRPFGQEDMEQDYQLLHVLSNLQVPQDPQGNRQWQQNRRHYDESKGVRRHYIAHESATQEPVAYAAIEQQGSGLKSFRLYLVFNPNQWAFSDLGEFLYQHLLKDAQAWGADTLALVEYANDLRFLNFLREHDFAQVGEGTYNGFAIMRMEKKL
ncbi:MAG: hypothetical protein JO316_10830 [Abitibacteriaceae bacterium]|nr:hypothetical protein [Abditibacteriaceae bacterium]